MSLEHTKQEPKWRRLPEERPHQIIDAAIEVFGEHGLAGARLEDIAKRAGLSKGTIYLYFPNKEALFKEMVRETLVARLEEEERAVAAHPGSAKAQLSAYMRGYWAFLRTPQVVTIVRLIIGELQRFPELVGFYMNEVVTRKRDLVTGMIRRGVAAGEFRPVDPNVAARLLMSMFSAHCVWRGMHEYAPDVMQYSADDLPEEIEDFFFRALQ